MTYNLGFFTYTVVVCKTSSELKQKLNILPRTGDPTDAGIDLRAGVREPPLMVVAHDGSGALHREIRRVN